jgi:hypothetical protein
MTRLGHPLGHSGGIICSTSIHNTLQMTCNVNLSLGGHLEAYRWNESYCDVGENVSPAAQKVRKSACPEA